jgi:carbamoyltransferase
MVLNTSFNVKGQPIVNTPDEAIETFLGTGIEFLFLENFHVTRSGA